MNDQNSNEETTTDQATTDQGEQMPSELKSSERYATTDPDVADSTDLADTLGGRGEDDANPASKDPAEWVTGDEPMTAAQASYLDTLAREAGEALPTDLTKAQASVEIERLQKATGRGQ